MPSAGRSCTSSCSATRARAPSKLASYASLVAAGKDPTASFAETLGPIEPLQSAFRLYYQREIFSFRRVNIDVSVERERFPVRQLPPAESASLRAMFHAVMRRPVEAGAAIAEARKADPKAAGSYVAEGLIADQNDKDAEAKAAYGKAVEFGTTNAYAYYRLASLTWQPNASRETNTEIEQLLTKAVGFNTRYADAYAWLGEVRTYLGNPEAIGLIRRAISLEPMDASHRLRAAGVLLNQGKAAEARVEAQAALTLAETDEQRRRAEQLLEAAAKAAAAPAPAVASTPSARPTPAAAVASEAAASSTVPAAAASATAPAATPTSPVPAAAGAPAAAAGRPSPLLSPAALD